MIGWNSLAMWSGSGFVVGDGQWVVTCFHVAARKLAGDRPLLPARLTVVSPWTGESAEARITRTNADADLALLRIEGPPLPALSLAPEDALDPEILRERAPGKVRLSGFPHLQTVADPAVPVRVASAETDVVAVVPREELPSLVLAPTPGPQKGWSGGPVTWPETGEVVGVFFAMVSQDETPERWFPHATPIRQLRELLREAGIDPEALRHPAAEPAPRPDQVDARFQHRMHAIIAAMDDRWDRMEAEARSLLKLTPDSASAHALLATALQERGSLEAALQEWDEAIRRAPRHAWLQMGRGGVLLARGRVEEAVAAYQKAETLALDDPDVPLGLAGALERAGRRLDSHRALERAVSLSPNHPLARWELAMSWRRWQNRPAALKEMAQAVALTDGLPMGEEFRLSYAAELDRGGRPQAAERELRLLLRRWPEMPEALLALASLFARQGRAEQARALADRVLAGPSEPQFRQAAQRILDRLTGRESDVGGRR